MTMARHLMANRHIPHGRLRLCFTLDEEIDRGVPPICPATSPQTSPTPSTVPSGARTCTRPSWPTQLTLDPGRLNLGQAKGLLVNALTHYRAFIWQTGTSFCGRVEDQPLIPECRGRAVIAVRDQICTALAETENK